MDIRRDAIVATERHFRVELADTKAAVREAQRLRHQVYRVERGYVFGPSDAVLDEDQYDDRARHVLLRQRSSGALVGTTRLVTTARDELPMTHYCGTDPLRHLPVRGVGEISRFALSKRCRTAGAWDSLLRLGLMQGILRASLEAGLTHWCALMEPKLIRLLRATGVSFLPIGPLVELNGLRQPAAAALNLVLADGKRRRPDFYDFVVGAGVGGEATPSADRSLAA